MMKYQINSLIEMKKPHACGTNLWKVTRVGVDIKIRCIKCDHEIMMDRLEFEKKLRRIKDEEN